MQNFRSLTQLLYQYEPTVLATAIEHQGIYYSNDSLGTVKYAEDDGDAWQCRRDPLHMQKIMFHTGDANTAPINTKSRALVLLEIYTETRGLREIYKDSMTDAYQMELGNFGWSFDNLPDFDAIQQNKTAPGAPPKKITNQGPPTAIIPIKEPQRKDDWFLIIEEAIKDFENMRGQTPSRETLWGILVKNPSEGWRVAYDNRKKHLTAPTCNPLDRSAFNKRYKRYYTDKIDH